MTPRDSELPHELEFPRYSQGNKTENHSLLGYERLRLYPVNGGTGDEVHPVTILARERGRTASNRVFITYPKKVYPVLAKENRP
ncbi:hypothetical protein MTP99_003659 [Tenebrio molitor]|nr:hypothetical protein MTP99_003659 [Tenebrio molitor]